MKNLNLIIEKPIITEKSMDATRDGSYTFLVKKDCTKREIKIAVSEQFKVHPVSVKTIILKGKKRKVGKKRMEVQKSSIKKAIVKLKDGEKIDAFEVGGK